MPRAGGAGYDEATVRSIIAATRPHYETAQEVVLAVLRESIVRGALPPGARLRQEDLAALFDTSRIPVREALRILEYEGLVSSQPHRGFTVTTLDPNEIEEIYDLRVVLESHAVRLAVPLLTEGDMAELERIYKAMAKASDPDSQLALREQFYLRIYAVTTRPRLVGLIARLRQEVARSLRWKLVQHSPSHHEVFFDAIRAGDAEAAVVELTSHYRKVAALLRRFLREPESLRDGEPVRGRLALPRPDATDPAIKQ
jgi:DNA-binding GntR family transcriptional regulator